MRPAVTAALALLVALAAGSPAAGQVVSVADFPADRQLVPRVGLAVTATLRIAGAVTPAATPGGRLSANLTTAAGAPVDEASLALADLPAGAASDFALELAVPVARVDHTVVLALERADGTSEVLAEAARVVAGDVFVVNGQSNAEARGRIANVDRDPFLRGYNPPGGGDPGNVGWVELRYAPGGYWAGRTANRLSAELDVPVAVFNFAEGGRDIAFFEPGHPSGNYADALAQLTAAGVAPGAVRAFLWAQGEADGFEMSIREYRARLTALLARYRADLGLDEVRVLQTRPYTCFATEPNPAEAQRRAARELEWLRVLATTNVPQHPDGCHFDYEGGYAVIGERVADWLREEVYGLPLAGTQSPDVDSARVTGPREITAYLDVPGSTLAVSGAPWGDFVAEGVDLAATDGTIVGNALVLGFPAEVGAATGLSYRGRDDASLAYLRNARGVGALLWHDVSLVPGDGAAGRPADVRLSLARTDGAGVLPPGAEARVDVVVANTGGSSLTDVVVGVVRPADLAYPTRGGPTYRGRARTAGDFDGDTGLWVVPSLRPGATATLELEFVAGDDAVSGAVVWAEARAHDQSDADSRPADGEPGAVRADDEARVVIGAGGEDCSLDVDLAASGCAAHEAAVWRLAFAAEPGGGADLAFAVAPAAAVLAVDAAAGALAISVDSLDAAGLDALALEVARPAGPLACANAFALALPAGCSPTAPAIVCDTAEVLDTIACDSALRYTLRLCDTAAVADTLAAVGVALGAPTCPPADNTRRDTLACCGLAIACDAAGACDTSALAEAVADSLLAALLAGDAGACDAVACPEGFGTGLLAVAPSRVPLRVIPNPVSAGARVRVELDAHASAGVPLRLYESTGRLARSLAPPPGAASVGLDLPRDLPPGFYVLRHGRAVARLLVE